MRNPARECEMCAAFEPLTEDDGDVIKGSCNRFAPRSFPGHYGKDDPETVWPTVLCNDWCLEWMDKAP